MSQKSYVPLHVHTEFSLLDGALKIGDLVSFAKEQGWPAVAITDHGNIFGAVKLFEKAKKAGLKAIVGCEMYLIPDVADTKTPEKKYYHQTILVQNSAGYANLCRLMEFAYSKGFYFKPRIDYTVLEQWSEGLIIGSGCLGGHISKLLRHGHTAEADARIEWFLRIFGPERFFLEVMPADTEKQALHNKLILERGAKFGVKVVATPDTHYFKQEHHLAHEVMLSIGTKDLLTNPNRFSFGEFKGHLKSTDEMLAAFPDNPEVVSNSVEFAERCNFAFEFGKLHFPQFEVPAGHTQESFFREESTKGLEELFEKGLVAAEKRAAYFARLTLEVDLITTMGYIGYFLVVSDFISWAKTQSIPVGPGRGSAAGSLVAWALKITNIDPIEYGLLFERFLNPERVSMPDIDIDFCIEGREKVIQYVRDKYGSDCVCQIITFGTMMAKGVIKDVSRVLGFPFADSNAITDLVPETLKITLKEALEQEPRLKNIIDSNPKAKEMMDICLVLEGLTRHASKHAAGVVISPQPLRDVLPLYIPQKSTELVTQFPMFELESLGYLKMDFLGLKNLTVIDRTVRAIKQLHDIDIDLDKLPRDDKKTFELLGQGKTCGVFQFEGDGVTEVMKRLKPEKFEDLIAVNALYRPGPLGSGMVDDFIDGRHGRKEVTYAFPELESVLAETYGVIVYQEQVMKIASVIAGYSLGGADILRRAMGKKKAEVMAEQKQFFVEGATKLGFNETKSEKLFDLMAYFAGYGFNKSHSAAYALIAYQTAYLKAHFPAEFEAAILSFETGDPDKLREYLNKTRQAGVKILPPNINESQIEFWATGKDQVIFGIKGVKNLGEAALNEIFEVRAQKKFIDLFDFCKRANLRVVNKRVIESLICAGAMDIFPGSRAQKITELEDIMNLAQQEKDREAKGQVDLFSTKKAGKAEGNFTYEFKTNAEWTQKETLEKEKEVIGFYVSAHPLDAYKNLEEWLETTSMGNDPAEVLGQEVTVLGVQTALKCIMTKKGDRMAFLNLEDQSGDCEVIIFPTTFLRVEENLNASGAFVVVGQVDKECTDRLKIKAQEVFPIDKLFAPNSPVAAIDITLPEFFDEAFLAQIKDNLIGHGLPVTFHYIEQEKILQLRSGQKMPMSEQNLNIIHAAGCEIKIVLKPTPKPKQSFMPRNKGSF